MKITVSHKDSHIFKIGDILRMPGGEVLEVGGYADPAPPRKGQPTPFRRKARYFFDELFWRIRNVFIWDQDEDYRDW